MKCSRCEVYVSKHNECYEKDPTVCHACTVKERDQLKAERDEARREFCEEFAPFRDMYPDEYAKSRGWDCFEGGE